MHEMSIAVALVEQLESIAEKNQLPQISSIELEIGYLKQVIPELFVDAFKEAAQGTVAKGASVDIIEIKPEAVCQKCQFSFEPELTSSVCPQCHVADVKIIKGEDIILKSVSS